MLKPYTFTFKAKNQQYNFTVWAEDEVNAFAKLYEDMEGIFAALYEHRKTHGKGVFIAKPQLPHLE